MVDKKYVGKGKENEKFQLVNISVCLSDIPKEDIYEYNGKKYINLTVSKMRQVDKHGKTHTVFINDFKPKQGQQNQPENIGGDGDTLPF